jgi:hypothetical protein
VPESAALTEPPGVAATENVPVRVPSTVGMKRTKMWQLCRPGSVGGHWFCEIMKSGLVNIGVIGPVG